MTLYAWEITTCTVSVGVFLLLISEYWYLTINKTILAIVYQFFGYFVGIKEWNLGSVFKITFIAQWTKWNAWLYCLRSKTASHYPNGFAVKRSLHLASQTQYSQTTIEITPIDQSTLIETFCRFQFLMLLITFAMPMSGHLPVSHSVRSSVSRLDHPSVHSYVGWLDRLSVRSVVPFRTVKLIKMGSVDNSILDKKTPQLIQNICYIDLFPDMKHQVDSSDPLCIPVNPGGCKSIFQGPVNDRSQYRIADMPVITEITLWSNANEDMSRFNRAD